MKVARNLALSLEILSAHRLRTLLSVTGVTIGVAAVIVMASVGKGAEERILERIRAMGTDLLVVNAARARVVAGRERQASTSTSLRAGDAEALVEECPAVLRAAPAIGRPVSLRHEGRSAATTLTGLTPEGLAIRNVSLSAGRTFDEDDERARRRVALLGPTVVERLFGAGDPVGLQVLVGRVPFEVVGVTRRRGVDANGTDQDDLVLVPLETALRRVFNLSYVTTIYVQARGASELDRAEREIRSLLSEPARSSVRGPSFTIQNQAGLLRARREAARSLTRLVGGVAAVSLTAGGIGVLAVMLLAVRERRKEIGVRRAVGATRRDIFVQFLAEASCLAAAGGLLGILLGVAATSLLSATGACEAILSVPAVAAAAVSALTIGLVSGTYPAVRAARLPPVWALRGL